MRTRHEIETDIRCVESRLEELQTELRDLDIPPEPKGSTPTIKFSVQFVRHGTCYTYVAYRVKFNSWYITGRVGPHSWAKVVELMREDYTVKKLRGGRPLYYNFDEGKWAE